MGEDSMALVLNSANLATAREGWLSRKRAELVEAEQVVAVYKDVHPDATRRQVRRVRDKIDFLRKYIHALEAGYIPIPRFDAQHLEWSDDPMPAHALFSIAEAQKAGIFTEIGEVTGHEPYSKGPYPAARRRDPLVVGIIKAGGVLDGYDAHFLIAWWQPEDLPPSALL